MEKEFGIVTFKNSIQDTFPYVEAAIVILDNNLNWWKQNFGKLEELIANEAAGIADNPVNIRTRFTVYSGPDEAVDTVIWSGPAIEFTFIEKSSDFVRQLKNSIGNTWEGHRLITDDNKLITLFE